MNAVPVVVYSDLQIRQWLIEQFSRISDVSQADIDVDRPFVDYDLDSAVAVTLSKHLSDFLGSELPITLFWEYPSIASLSSALGSSTAAS